MHNTLHMISHSLGYMPPYTIVPTFYDGRTRAARLALENLREDFNDHLWPAVIPSTQNSVTRVD